MAAALRTGNPIQPRDGQRENAGLIFVFADSYMRSDRRRHPNWWGSTELESTINIAPHEVTDQLGVVMTTAQVVTYSTGGLRFQDIATAQIS